MNYSITMTKSDGDGFLGVIDNGDLYRTESTPPGNQDVRDRCADKGLT